MLAVSSRAWSELLHAQVGTLLGRAGIPCLHIKGPTVATWQALYPDGERSWGDVDILLPPSGMDRALEVLLASGFSHRDPGLRWRTSEDHALTLWHDPDGTATHGAAAEVDVHHRFQGMEGDPERVFAELWRRREPAELGGLDVWFPDLPSRSLIVVLNAARDPHGAKAQEDLRRLVAVATDADWRRTIALARRVDALQALRAGLELEPAWPRPRCPYLPGRRPGVGRVAAARAGLHPHRRPDRGAARPAARSPRSGQWRPGSCRHPP